MNRPSPRFLAQLAHDLRSPLNVIGSGLTELSMDTFDRDQIVALSQRAVSRLISLSDRLALAARLAQPFEPALEPVDLLTFSRDTVAQFALTQLRRRVAMATAWPEAPVKVRADSGLLNTLVLELLTNANRFARRQVKVELVVGDSAVLTIDDDGEGIQEDERPVVFEAFAERRSRTGLGMGLWLARELATHHRGALDIHHLELGTRVQLTLPLAAR